MTANGYSGNGFGSENYGVHGLEGGKGKSGARRESCSMKGFGGARACALSIKVAVSLRSASARNCFIGKHDIERRRGWRGGRHGLRDAKVVSNAQGCLTRVGSDLKGPLAISVRKEKVGALSSNAKDNVVTGVGDIEESDSVSAPCCNCRGDISGSRGDWLQYFD